MKGVAATNCESVAQQTGLEKPEINLVFIAESHDTRYEKYSVLRPFDAAS
jgi:hypothetical protein